MALVKKNTPVNRTLVIAIVVIVVLAGGYFVAQRFVNPAVPTTNQFQNPSEQVITEFGESILGDPRFTQLRQFGRSVTIDGQPAGNPNPFR